MFLTKGVREGGGDSAARDGPMQDAWAQKPSCCDGKVWTWGAVGLEVSLSHGACRRGRVKVVVKPGAGDDTPLCLGFFIWERK